MDKKNTDQEQQERTNPTENEVSGLSFYFDIVTPGSPRAAMLESGNQDTINAAVASAAILDDNLNPLQDGTIWGIGKIHFVSDDGVWFTCPNCKRHYRPHIESRNSEEWATAEPKYREQWISNICGNTCWNEYLGVTK